MLIAHWCLYRNALTAADMLPHLYTPGSETESKTGTNSAGNRGKSKRQRGRIFILIILSNGVSANATANLQHCSQRVSQRNNLFISIDRVRSIDCQIVAVPESLRLRYMCCDINASHTRSVASTPVDILGPMGR